MDKNSARLNRSVAALFARTAHGIRPGLEVIQTLLEELGNPHHRLAVIHVAGTNGKGSVCAMLESVLRASGFKTGLYTSPHLVHFNERFRLNGVQISDEMLERYIGQMEQAALALEERGIRPATFFEISTALAYQYFADEQVDIAVIETGMGGRWDATNTVVPLVSVITHIDVDHVEFLGDDIEKIAAEKAGIIKSGRPVISAPQPENIMSVLEQEGEPVIYSSGAVSVVKASGASGAVRGQRLKIETHSRNLPPIDLPLLGECQRENCAVAVAALEVIADIVDVEPEFKTGLESVEWGARFQILSESPLVILDGAHNVSAANALVKTLKEFYPRHQIGFVFGFLEDKDAGGFLRIIKPLVSKAWTIPITAARGLTAEAAGVQLGACGITASAETVEGGWCAARAWADSGTRRIVCITGSLYIKSMLEGSGLVEPMA